MEKASPNSPTGNKDGMKLSVSFLGTTFQFTSLPYAVNEGTFELY